MSSHFFSLTPNRALSDRLTYKNITTLVLKNSKPTRALSGVRGKNCLFFSKNASNFPHKISDFLIFVQYFDLNSMTFLVIFTFKH